MEFCPSTVQYSAHLQDRKQHVYLVSGSFKAQSKIRSATAAVKAPLEGLHIHAGEAGHDVCQGHLAPLEAVAPDSCLLLGARRLAARLHRSICCLLLRHRVLWQLGGSCLRLGVWDLGLPATSCMVNILFLQVHARGEAKERPLLLFCPVLSRCFMTCLVRPDGCKLQPGCMQADMAATHGAQICH